MNTPEGKETTHELSCCIHNAVITSHKPDMVHEFVQPPISSDGLVLRQGIILLLRERFLGCAHPDFEIIHQVHPRSCLFKPLSGLFHQHICLHLLGYTSIAQQTGKSLVGQLLSPGLVSVAYELLL